MGKSKPLAEILAGWDAYNRPTNGTHFRHYKGGEYEIVATGFLENDEVPAVVYRSLLKDIVWVRTADNFFETVISNGAEKPRFEKIKDEAQDPLPYIGKPAASALEAIGVTKASQLKDFSEKELLAIHGIGPKAIRMLREAGVGLRGM